MKSYKESFLFTALLALVFMPIAIMLILTGAALAETAELEDGTDFVFVMEPGEAYDFTCTFQNQEEGIFAYLLKPDITIIDLVDFEETKDLIDINDVWVWFDNENWHSDAAGYVTFLKNDEQGGCAFSFRPPKNTPAGDYEFTYQLVKYAAEDWNRMGISQLPIITDYGIVKADPNDYWEATPIEAFTIVLDVTVTP